MMRKVAVFVSCLFGASAAASAQHEPLPDCGDLRFALPAPFEAWFNPRQDATSLIVNEPALVVLSRAANSGGGSRSPYSAEVPFTIDRDGRYQIAVRTRVAIDVVRDGEIVRSGRWRAGPACSDVHRIYSYRLRRGRHVLRLRGAGTRVKVMIYQ